MGTSRSYQLGNQRRAWNSKAASAATKKPVCKHRSLSTPPIPRSLGNLPLPGSWDVGTTAPGEHTVCFGCCNIMPASVTKGSCHIQYHSLPTGWVNQSPLVRCSFNPLLSGKRTDARGWPTRRGRAKSKAEPQKLCEQRREREISPSSHRSSRLNLHSQLDVPCICGTPE